MSGDNNIGIYFINKLIKLKNNQLIITINDILTYFLDPNKDKLYQQKKFNNPFNQTFSIDKINYEHIIVHRSYSISSSISSSTITPSNAIYKFYRKDSIDLAAHTITMHEIIKNNVCYYTNNPTDLLNTITINYNDDDNNICVLSLNTKILKESDIYSIYHGTGRRMPSASDYAPYNLYGNWFMYDTSSSHGIQTESTTYLTKPLINYLYRYKLKHDITVYNIDMQEGTEIIDSYIFLHIMFFNITIGSYNFIQIPGMDRQIIFNQSDTEYSNKTLLFYDDKSKRTAANIIDKYNYTNYKNLIDRDKPKFTFSDPSWQFILGYTGDGDKPIAAKLCETYNENLINPNNHILGWYLNVGKPTSHHLMLCNPMETIENTNVYLVITEHELTNNKLTDEFVKQVNNLLKSKDFNEMELINDNYIISISKGDYKKFNDDILPAFSKSVKNEIIRKSLEMLNDPIKIVNKKNQLISSYSESLFWVIFSKIKDVKYTNIMQDIKFNFLSEYTIKNTPNLKTIKIEIIDLIKKIYESYVCPTQSNPIGNESVTKSLLLGVIMSIIELFTEINQKIKNRTPPFSADIIQKIEQINLTCDNHDCDEFIKTAYDKFNEYIESIDKSINEMTVPINPSVLPNDLLQVGGYKKKYLKYKLKYFNLKKKLNLK